MINRSLRKLFRVPVASRSGNINDAAFVLDYPGRIVGRMTRDLSHPADSALHDSAFPIAFYGCVGVNTAANTVRGIQPGDTAASVTGIAVQTYPFQSAFAAQPFGGQPFNAMVAPSPGAFINFLRSGWAAVYCNGAAQVNKTTPVYIWNAPSTGLHINGMCEASPTATAVVAPKQGGNAGNGTLGTPNVNAANAGTYTVSFTSATAFNVTAPGGATLQPGTVGTAYNANGLQFTATAGSNPFAAGDAFTLAVTASTLLLPQAFYNGTGDSANTVELGFNI